MFVISILDFNDAYIKVTGLVYLKTRNKIATSFRNQHPAIFLHSIVIFEFEKMLREYHSVGKVFTPHTGWYTEVE